MGVSNFLFTWRFINNRSTDYNSENKKMTQRSTENEENNESPPKYSTVTSLAQDKSAILIENEQLKAENEIAMAVLAAHILQQEGQRSSSSREFIKLMVFLCVKVFIIPVSIVVFVVILRLCLYY